MTKPTLLALTSLFPQQMDELEQHFDVVRLYKENNPETKLNEVKDDVTAVIATMNNPVRESLINALPNLEIISLCSVGFDNVELQAAKAQGVVVTNTPDLVTDDTADTAMALILAVSRRIVEADAFVRIGRWENRGKLPHGRSLTGKKVGIVGLGRIGQAIAKRCEAFGMDIAYHGRKKKEDVQYPFYSDVNELARVSDYLVLSCPGGEETRHMIGKGVFESLGEHSFLINVSRGSVVDEKALVQALQAHKIAGAGLDVFENEPVVPDELKTMDNVVMLPHIGTATVETRTAMGDLVVKNLLAHIDGKDVLTPVQL